VNFPRFVSDFRPAIVDDFTKLYAIARHSSKVTAAQFHGFSKKVGAPIREASAEQTALFEREMIEKVFSVTEYAFNSAIICRILRERLDEAGVTVQYGVTAKSIAQTGSGLTVTMATGERLRADKVFVAAYSGINTLLRSSGLQQLPMKHEITEVALVRHPAPLDSMGITVMDGAFFSTMPFPDRKAHSFTHVRYTPHGSWLDTQEPQDPYTVLKNRHPQTTYPLMVKDSQRFLPAVANATYLDSLFEIKTVLTQNEGNDGRPILLRNNYGDLPGLSVVMGGKIDNIYDILEALDSLREAAEARGSSWITRLIRGE
jgi:glycine/D-amino acid oxidase-like deaminating enzyme